MRAERRKIFGADRIVVEVAERADGVDAVHEQVVAPARPERDSPHARCVLDRWQRFRGSQERLAQLRSMRAINDNATHVQLDDQHRVHVVSQMDLTHTVETAHEKASTYKKQHRERALQDE